MDIKCSNYGSGKKSVQLCPSNKNQLLILNNNFITLLDTETKRQKKLEQYHNQNTMGVIPLSDNRILFLKSKRNNVNGRSTVELKLELVKYSDDFSQPTQILNPVSSLDIPGGEDFPISREETAGYSSLAFCHKNNTIAIVSNGRELHQENRRPIGNQRVSSITFLKLRGNNKLFFQTKYDIFQRHLPQHIGVIFSGNALTTSFLTIIMKDGGNSYHGRILTVPYDVADRKVLDYRIEDNEDIFFGNNNYGIHLEEHQGRFFGIDNKKNFYFLSVN